ncbi:MAG TPA: alkaline phosphatase family protein [Anaerolineales bacterium]
MIRLRKYGYILSTLFASLLMFTTGAQASAPVQPNGTKTPIQHLIVLMQENHTFDNYFGTYPGVDGLPAGTCMPVDPTNPSNTNCVKPFHIGDLPITDLDHSLATFQLQFASGKMNGFVYAQNQRNIDGKIAMGYYDGSDIPYYWNLADEYVLFDRFFSSDHSGSPENHMFWVTAQSGSNRIATKGYGNDVQTIFDELQASGVSWKFYVENYDPKINYRTVGNVTGNRESQVIWVPLLNFDRFIDNPTYASHIVDLNQYYTDLQNGTLPAVAYIAPSGASEHPPGSIRSGEKFVKALVQALLRSDAWSSSAFVLAYDDWGGWYDHVKPPQVDQNGYGFRVPVLLISAYARRGYVDHTQLDFTSILKFIEDNWSVAPLTQRDANANSLVSAFDFSSPPRAPFYIPLARQTSQLATEPRRVVIYGFYGAALLIAALVFGRAIVQDVRAASKTVSDSSSQS